MEKVFVILFALVAGVGGAVGYEYAVKHVSTEQEREENGDMLFLRGKLTALEQKLQSVADAQDSTSPQAEILAARLDALESRMAVLQEKKAAHSPVAADGPAGSEETTSSAGTYRSPEDAGRRRISGEELIDAMKELPEEGVQMIRSAIRKEVERIRRQQEEKKNPRADLQRKAEEGIQKLTTALSLTPVQVEQAKEIAARFIDKIVEVDRIARERDDPEFAANAKKELEVELKADVVQILTPEQLDKARELDPEGIGRQYPRGF